MGMQCKKEGKCRSACMCKKEGKCRSACMCVREEMSLH